MPLLTIFANALIAILPRLLIYILAMFVGAGAATAGTKIAEKRAADEKRRREAARAQRRAQ